MKKLKNRFLFLPFLCLLFLASCSQQEGILAEMDTQATPAMDTDNPLQLLCCAQSNTFGMNQCLIAFEFKPNVPDGNFPQGAYPVQLITGDCECDFDSSGIQLITTGSTSILSAYTGGPAGGAACNSSPTYLASNLFNTPFSGGWTTTTGSGNGTGGTNGTWGGWTQYVSDERQQYADPNNAPVIGLTNYPQSWNISVVGKGPEDKVTVGLGTIDQSNQLRRIGIFSGGNGSAVTYAAADGSRSYDLDMAGQPDGLYVVKMDFEPGFHLVNVFLKTSSTPRK